MDQDDTATGPNTESPLSKVSESTSSTQDSTPPSIDKSSSVFSAKSSSPSSEHEPSNQAAGSDVVPKSPIAMSDPLRSLRSNQCESYKDEGKKICRSASESTQHEAQTSGVIVVAERNNQDANATATQSNAEHPPSRLILNVMVSNGSAASESLNGEQILFQTSEITIALKQNSQTATATESNTASDSLQRQPTLTAQTSGRNVMNHPSRNLLSDYNEYSTRCLRLHMAALNGNVNEAKILIDHDPSKLREAITEGDETVFHVATGANQFKFVEEMVKLLEGNVAPLELQDRKGNTAFCYAAAAGTKKIAEILLVKDRSLLQIRGFGGNTPLYIAALFGKRDMALFLYEQRNLLIAQEGRDILSENDRKDIFFISIHTGLYELALKLLKDDETLAVLRDENNMTALHLLANNPSAFTSESPGLLKRLKNMLISVIPGKNSTTLESHSSTQALELLHCLWEKILAKEYSNVVNFISEPTRLLFDAARLGNVKFLAELICHYPRLVHELDEEGRSIFHIAVLHRHVDIFNLIYDIGFDKQLIAAYEDEKSYNLMHLAAEYLSHGRAVSMVPGAALEMQQELITFKEVKSLVMPMYKEYKNSEGSKPQELFTNKHAELLKKGEEWMKTTATSCSLVAALIATVVFAAAFQLPGGNFGDGTPDHLRKTVFRIFAIAEAISLSFSSTSILMFLSILTSRYREEDFLWSLPLKLVVGISTLFISIITMMLAFSSSFFLAYTKDRSNPIPIIITTLVFVPVGIFVLSQFDLLIDVLRSSIHFRFSIKPRKGRRLKCCAKLRNRD